MCGMQLKEQKQNTSAHVWEAAKGPKTEYFLLVWPLSTISAICPKVMQGKKAVTRAVTKQRPNI